METACKPLVGHTFIQRLQRLHVAKKSVSIIAPGGRSRRASPLKGMGRSVKPTMPPASSAVPSLKSRRREGKEGCWFETDETALCQVIAF